MLVFGGHDPREALASTVDTVCVTHAIRSLVGACRPGDVLLVPQEAAMSWMVRILREERDYPLVRSVSVEDEARSGLPLSAIVVMGGSEGTLVSVQELAAAHPEAAIIPLASTGGAAARLAFDIPGATHRASEHPYVSPASLAAMLDSGGPGHGR